MTTIHETVVERVRGWRVVSGKKRVPRAALRQIVQEVLDTRRSTSLDFRADHAGLSWGGERSANPWKPGDTIQIGSGRAADWCHIGYLQYALICRILHQHLGWSGQQVRDAGRALQRGMDGGGHDWVPPVPMLPAQELVRIAQLPGDHDWTYDGELQLPERTAGDADQHRALWRLWIWRVAAPAWGRLMLADEVERLRRDPNAYASNLIVGEIRRLAGADVTDYRGCSGCQYLRHVAELDQATRESILMRTKEVEHVQYKGVDGVVVPFGLPFPEEFDYAVVLGMNAEVRVRSKDWKGRSYSG